MRTIGSLFSGIGGLELGLERAGVGQVVWQVEQDEFCRRVLAKHWPGVDRSTVDVRHASASTLVPVDVICGGFPCQDVSGAGKGAGLGGARSGLWWEFRRVVAELRPSVVVVENVASGAKRWLCAVRGALQELGYRTRALGVAARDVGAPHRRERIFVVAYADGIGRVEPEGREPEQRRWVADGGTAGSWSDVADADRVAVRHEQGRRGGQDGAGSTELERRGPGMGDASGKGRPRSGGLWVHDKGEGSAAESGRRFGEAQRGLGGGAHGLPSRVDGDRWPATRGQAQHAWEPPRTVNQFVPKRRARLRALGNAVVPQCAEVVGRVVFQDLMGGGS